MGRIITAIETQKRNQDRVNIYLDGQYAFGVARILAAWLHIGQELSEEKIARLIAEDAHESAYSYALRLLDRQERTEKDLRQHLARKDIPEETVQGVIERLRRAGLLDDQRYAQNWVENRSVFRPRSRSAMAYELKLKGISKQSIDQALVQVDDEQMAYLAAQKYSRRLISYPWPEYRQKMLSFLARRGFSYETSAPIASRIWDEIHQGDETVDFETYDKEVNP